MANADHVGRLRESVEGWNAWRIVREGMKPDLRGARLAELDLRGADLSRADLAGADLRGADLRDANLSEANLTGTNLRGADLGGADLSGARLDRADLRDTRLAEPQSSGGEQRDAALPDNDAGSSSRGADEAGGAEAGGRDSAMISTPASDDLAWIRDHAMLSTRIERDWSASVPPSSSGPETPRRERPIGSDPSDRQMRFTTYHPHRMRVGESYRLLAYAHTVGATALVRQDRWQELGAEGEGHARAEGRSSRPCVPDGTVITVTPQSPDCEFRPIRRRFRWTRDWHRADFRLSVHRRPGEPLPDPVLIRVSFFVGPILLGETTASARVDATSPIPDPRSAHEASGESYRSIFVSYSRRDSFVVRRVKDSARLIGDRILQDVDSLRSGEDWDSGLLELIEEADVFQLYWSSAASESRFVQREWRHALARSRAKRRFIRPLYWQTPMPEPPEDLASLHFAFLDLGPWGRLRANLSRRVRR